jgi:predicted kinase
MLIVLSGLPGVGKTTIARELARSLTAVYLRIGRRLTVRSLSH